ncbi:multicopper oxidase-domain-containing protein [Aspergillus novoparasiticus]|uniref:Multicopper oxidase-domain-containing protein n=1 Tax=Aspergillus novoparasiticus TaxID=986946 RepID=A0A5N6ERP4_9EURO|nr:multicopper oxidase-domain-containing protein [Aspergillus novoparasiticus]
MRVLILFLGALALDVLNLVQANSHCPGNDLLLDEIVHFDLVLTEAAMSPDGFSRKGIMMNGQFPGPLLELCQGNNVELSVLNLLPYSITVHFHGIEQRNTPWSDGVPGLSQKGIQSGESFTYQWKATEYGSYFYHAHEKGYMEDGLYGPIYIHPRDSQPRPFGLITSDPDERMAMRVAEDNSQSIMLSDWRHHTSDQVWDIEQRTGLDAYCANSLLINGKGSVSCLPPEFLDDFLSMDVKHVLNGTSLTDMGCIPPTVSLVEPYPHTLDHIPDGLFWGCADTVNKTQRERLLVDANRRYASWNLISAASLSALAFSVDQHPMYVYAIDGRYIEPVIADVVSLIPGRRLSVLIKLDKPAGHYTVRSVIDGFNQILNTTADLSYVNTIDINQRQPSGAYIDIAGRNTTPEVRFFDEKTVTPYPAEIPAQTADETFILKVHRFNSSYLWTLGNTTYPLSLEQAAPLLFYPQSEVAKSDLSIRTKNGSWVDIIANVTSTVQPEHPIHKHSNKFFLIGYGQGVWNYSTVADAMSYIPGSFNLNNPPLFDTIATLPAITGPSWIALRYHVNNPGAFLIHCHIQVHTSGGMALAMLDGVDAWPEIPEQYQIS